MAETKKGNIAKKSKIAKPVVITSATVQMLSVQQRIFVIRDKQVMVDRDLAALYGVETRVLKQAVNRNPERFPEEFMFQLDNQEFEKWRSQVVMSNSDKMGLRYHPYVFTEQGVAMLSSVLRSATAVRVNKPRPVGFAATEARYEEERKRKAQEQAPK